MPENEGIPADFKGLVVPVTARRGDVDAPRPQLVPVEHDPWETPDSGASDAEAAQRRYEAHLLEMHEGHQAGIAGGGYPLEDYLGGVVRRAREVGKERLTKAADVLSAPGDVLFGNREMTPEQVQEYGGGLAPYVMLGGIGAAGALGQLKPSPNQLGIIAGREAMGADLAALAERDRIANPLTDPRNVGAYRKTGWYYGPDGLPRFEVDDSGARLTGVEQLLRPGDKVKLSQLWDHPELYKAYPHMADMEMNVEAPRFPGELGAFNPDTNSMRITTDGLKQHDLEGIFAHESQHAVQFKEGFGKGANPTAYQDPLMLKDMQPLRNEAQKLLGLVKAGQKLTPEQQQRIADLSQFFKKYNAFSAKMGPTGYKFSSGENEANAVMERLNLGIEARQLHMPWQTKVPVESQDVVPPVTWAGYQRGQGGFGPQKAIPLLEILKSQGFTPSEALRGDLTGAMGEASDAMARPTLKLNRVDPDEMGLPEGYRGHVYELNKEGKRVGFLDVMPSKDGKHLEIRDVFSLDAPTHSLYGGEGGKPPLGTAEIREGARQLKEIYPGMEVVGGRRVSGARFGGEKVGYYTGQGQDVEVPLSRFLKKQAQQESSGAEYDPGIAAAEKAGGGKGPGEPADVAKSTEAAIKTPSAAVSPPPEKVRELVSKAKSEKWEVDRTHDVPYGAGAAKEGGKTYIDRRIPSKMSVGGKSFDPAEFLQVHEQVEHRLMEHGLGYEEAHRYATAQERSRVESRGIDWRKYEKVMERWLDVTEEERGDKKMPADLYIKPYSHSDLRKFKGKAGPHVN